METLVGLLLLAFIFEICLFGLVELSSPSVKIQKGVLGRDRESWLMLLGQARVQGDTQVWGGGSLVSSTGGRVYLGQLV